MREPQHIGGFFVKSEYHRKGIGRDLFDTIEICGETMKHNVLQKYDNPLDKSQK